jgi:general secretion pathway protein G
MQDGGMLRKTNDQMNGSMNSSGREDRWPACSRIHWYHVHGGFTLFELMISMAILGILMALASLSFSAYRERVQVACAIADIHTIQNAIDSFQIDHDQLPVDLAEVHWDSLNDPWGHPYQYTNFETTPRGKWRKDKFLVPINSTYDLWSMGPDGKTKAELVTPVARDDIIRANDGMFIGRASRY